MATGDATATLMTTAQALLDQDGQLLIDHEALETFCNDRFQGLEDYHHRVRRVAFPLKFDSPLQEINFYTLASLLSFGAAYEDKLEDSPRDTILFGLIGLHISRVELNAGWLCSTNRGDLSNLFGINTFELVPIPPGVGEEEKQEEMVVEAKDPEHQPSQQQQQQQRRLPTSAITVERPGPLSRYVDDIVKVMHTTGERLQELGCPSMSRFILNAVKGQQPSASILTHALASTFPHFEDVIRGGEVEVRLRKKAVMLAAELYHRTRQVRSRPRGWGGQGRGREKRDNVLDRVPYLSTWLPSLIIGCISKPYDHPIQEM